MSTSAHLDERTSLAALPHKLKQRIVAHLDELALYAEDAAWEDEASDAGDKQDENETAAGAASLAGDDDQADLAVNVDLDLFSGPEDQRRSTLSALSLVSKEWHALVAPVIWKELWLYARSTESLLELAQDILPRHAEHVQQLCLRESPFDTLLADDKGDELPLAEGRALEIVEHVEALVVGGGGGGGGSLEWELRTARARTDLLAHIVEACPNVDALDLEGPLRIFKRLTWDVITAEDKVPPAPVEIPESDVVNSALAAVKALGSKVESLALMLPPDGVSAEQDAVDFLEAFPALKSLELNVCVLEDRRDAETVTGQRKALVAAVAACKNLEELALGTSIFVDDHLAAVTFSAPLKHLALHDALDLSFDAFITFLGNFSATLESLELDGAPATAPEDESLIPELDLPKLIALEIAAPVAASVFRLFANAPLREISIGESPQITTEDVVALLEAHKDTLVSVDLEEGAVSANGAVGDDDGQEPEEVIAAWCEEHGVEFAVIEGDDLVSSDSEDDDEGTEGAQA
ncbi:hypothetical protein JCM9279_004062 [Rhodotorula babjevae]